MFWQKVFALRWGGFSFMTFMYFAKLQWKTLFLPVCLSRNALIYRNWPPGLHQSSHNIVQKLSLSFIKCWINNSSIKSPTTVSQKRCTRVRHLNKTLTSSPIGWWWTLEPRLIYRYISYLYICSRHDLMIYHMNACWKAPHCFYYVIIFLFNFF